MEMPKLTPAVRAAYEAALPGDPRVQPKSMFGMPCAFVNGHMFYGTFQDSLVYRLSEAQRAAALQLPGVRPFEPIGRAWKEYVEAMIADVPEETLAALARQALEHTATLAPKEKKPAAPRKKKG